MTNNTTPTGRQVMAAIAVLAGILCLTIIPMFGGTAMDVVMKSGWARVADNGAIAPKMVSFFFPFWMALSMVAGTVLILAARPIYKGEYWARPLALGMLAIPSITAAYFFGPIMVTARQLAPQALTMMAIGLIPYFTILLYERTSLSDKLSNFTVFLLLGIMAAGSFTNGFSSLHELLFRPDPKIFTAAQHGFALGVPIDFLGIILVIIGIPFLAGRTRIGWWLCSIGTLAIFIGTFIFYLSKGNSFYLAGLTVSLINLVLLHLPQVGGRVLSDQQPTGKLFTPPLDKINL